MLEVTISEGPKAHIIESPIPTPRENEVVIKVVVSGSNPKDWKFPKVNSSNKNEGDDIAGIVHQVGKNVLEFKPGDRVAAYHEIGSPHGSYAEYAVAWDYTTFHIPEKTSFEEAATIPLAAATAWVGLFSNLRLPAPWTPATTPTPLIIYGGASSVGSFAIKLARRANIHPLLVVAGKSASYVESLIDRSRGDTIVDYREGVDAVVEGLKEALKTAGDFSHAPYALDAITEHSSTEIIAKVLDPQGSATFVQGYDKTVFPATVNQIGTFVGSVHFPDPALRDLGFAGFKYFGRSLQDGWFTGHPYQVRENGLEGVEAALTDLQDGKSNATKYIFRIADTPKLK